MQNENVASVAPRIRFGAQLENEQRTSDCLGIAVNPDLDQGTSKMTSYIIEGSYWEKGRKGEGQGIILGVKTAEELGVKVGDEVSILARTADFSPYLLVYNVRAIYRTDLAFLDKGMFYIHINDAAGLLNMYDAASEILVMIKDRDLAKQVAGEIKDTFAVNGLKQDLVALSWLEQGELESMLNNMKRMLSVYLLVFALVAGLTILNTMLMSVFERTNEIGMMRALGMKRLKIIVMIITESVSIAFLASITGGGIGAAFSYFFLEKIGIDLRGTMEETFSDWLIDPILRGSFQWTHLGIGLLFGILLAGIAALYPAIRAARMRPVEALRTI
jgi:ABC-type lipoprotein release transport system permease subunit